jgi:hypothetical protein
MSAPHSLSLFHDSPPLPPDYSRRTLCYPYPMQVTVEIPDRFLDSLIPAGTDPSRALLEESVAAAYREGRLGPRSIRQLLGFETRMQVDDFLHKHRSFGYTEQEFEKDLATLDKIREIQQTGQAA